MNTKDTENKLSDIAIGWLVRLQSETLSKEEEESFFAWLKADVEHQRAYIEAEWLWERVATEDDVGAEIGTEVEAVVSAESVTAAATQFDTPASHEGKVIPLRTRFIPRALAASVALFLLAMFAGVFIDYQNNNYVTDIGEQLDLILDDGTHLYLNTDSAIRTDLDGDRRLVYLNKGEVFFEVAKDSARPFLVKTEHGIIRVLGTSFNVLHGTTSNTVTVIEGSVGVSAGQNIEQAAQQAFVSELTLKPDQQVILGEQRTLEANDISNAGAVIAWREGKLIYSGEPFARVLSDISRYFEGEIRIGDPSLEALEVVAILQLQDKTSTLKALEAAFNVASVEVSDELTLLYPRN